MGLASKIMNVLYKSDIPQGDLVIIRGLPGAGKSHIARTEFPEYTLLEADDFFIDVKTKRYVFDSKFLAHAHHACQERAKALLEKGEKVVVANTFSRLWEIAPYLEMAKKPPVYKIVGDWTSIHNVPTHSINNMRDRWEDYPNEILIHNWRVYYAEA